MPKKYLAETLSVFGNEAPHQSTTSRWYGEFKRRRVNLSDDPRVGALNTAVTQENVDPVRKLIIEDRHVTYREIEVSLKILKTSIQKILHEELGVRKLVSPWIPYLLTEEQKAARVNWCQKTLDRFNSGNSKNVYSIVSGDESWIYCYEPEDKRQSAVWVFQGEGKPTKMVATFVPKAGHISTIPLNEQRTVTADWYTTICLPKNPDLSGQRFQSPEEAVDAFKNAVLDLPANEWNKCFENRFERMQIRRQSSHTEAVQ
ncbi:unnamed protein product [Acanthoscelides obtectus]|uniref:Transposase n=1 Tax=Acanthoscelides obtectus TaxID=200917 RepID=A0A9P0Q6B4_ACAOB|nr:unnamed protein product [Acanthoscelides obtectus]CAK1629909.1 Histone-lysine N-methyltransferase SETMAR [Acanthoscelides obtectus]